MARRLRAAGSCHNLHRRTTSPRTVGSIPDPHNHPADLDFDSRFAESDAVRNKAGPGAPVYPRAQGLIAVHPVAHCDLIYQPLPSSPRGSPPSPPQFSGAVGASSWHITRHANLTSFERPHRPIAVTGAHVGGPRDASAGSAAWWIRCPSRGNGLSIQSSVIEITGLQPGVLSLLSDKTRNQV